MKSFSKSGVLYFGLLVIMVLMSGCADVSPHAQQCVTSDPYGFFGGLWHGFILELSLVGSLFSDNIAIYAYNNNGGWYDFGFVIGVVSFTGGAVKITRK